MLMIYHKEYNQATGKHRTLEYNQTTMLMASKCFLYETGTWKT
jgi:hypothetical protein